MTTLYRRHPGVRHTALEGEGVVLHLGTRKYFSLNATGLDLFEALAEPRTFDDLVGVLTAAYDVTPERAAVSVRDFLEGCGRLDLVLVEEA